MRDNSNGSSFVIAVHGLIGAMLGATLAAYLLVCSAHGWCGNFGLNGDRTVFLTLLFCSMSLIAMGSGITSYLLHNIERASISRRFRR